LQTHAGRTKPPFIGAIFIPSPTLRVVKETEQKKEKNPSVRPPSNVSQNSKTQKPTGHSKIISQKQKREKKTTATKRKITK
jgi:hypothetical protein